MISSEIENQLTHEPVLKEEVLEWLQPEKAVCVVDCTVGMGGHSEAMLQRLNSVGRLVAIDRDANAILASKECLSAYSESVYFVCDNYRNIVQIVHRLRLTQVDRILIDCGISSVQLEESSRGFSFQKAGPLDMRMDTSQPHKLIDLLRNSSESELADTIFNYGQERYSRRIARAIKNGLKQEKIKHTKDLADVVFRSVPLGYRYGRIHPATRTFQALRIKINDELDSLREAVSGGIQCLVPGGRMVVISFHSLEDGMVKRRFKEAQSQGKGICLNKKPIEPSSEEVSGNPRSRSAKMRVFEKGQMS